MNLDAVFLETHRLSHDEKAAIPIHLIATDKYPAWLKQQTAVVRTWLHKQQIAEKTGVPVLLPDAAGALASVLVLYKTEQPVTERLASLPLQLPHGDYALAAQQTDPLLWLGWAMGAYQFTKYKKAARAPARLVCDTKQKEILNQVAATYLVRDLINLPADDMGPEQLAAAAKQIAGNFKADYHEIVGKDLVKQNFPAIYAVGRASSQAPRLLHLRWGKKSQPKIALVGKGVCFDTGGLDLKPSSGMRLMKKDMAGAAHVLGLAQLIMAQKLPVHLDVYIPAVENAVSGAAMHPGDVLTMRNGSTVEIDNTDAEGRLVLADAISYALENKPQLLIDFATLTGAARVAVGTDISAYFCNDKKLAQQLMKVAEKLEDPLWELPLYQPYFRECRSYIADFKNSGGAYGGAITAALFLEQFLTPTTPWIHFDVMAWNLANRSAHPEGGEAMGIRVVYEYLKQGKFL